MGGKLSLDLTCIISMEATLFLFGIITGMIFTLAIYAVVEARHGNY